MAWQSGAVERLRGFPSPDVLLRMLMLHVARGYSLRETVVRAKLANWADITHVKGVKQLGFRSGHWLSAEQSSEVLKHAGGDTMRANAARLARGQAEFDPFYRPILSEVRGMIPGF